MQYVHVNAGDQYGCYTVLGRADKSGSQEFYRARCRCGRESIIGKTRLLTNPERCRFCFGKDYSGRMAERRKEMIGQVVNGYRILDVIPPDESNSQCRFMAECVVCGDRRPRTMSAMKQKKGERCSHCPPDYGFEVYGETAVGHLADGTEFKIDTEDIPLVESSHWYVNGSGYLFHRVAGTREPRLMHRAVLGLTRGDGAVVDHLNHDKLDNRKANLSIGTQADNCLNNIQKCTNTIGHTGVRVSGNGRWFISRIEKGGRLYELLRTPDIETAAQAYNIAADFLFGVGVGYRNRVLYPSQEFACSIIEKIRAIQEDCEKVS